MATRSLIPRLALALLLSGWLGAGAADAQSCLSPEQAREALASGQVMSLAQIMGQFPRAEGRVLSQPQLCDSSGRLVYVVNILGRAGKVRQLTIDAASGAIVGGQ